MFNHQCDQITVQRLQLHSDMHVYQWPGDFVAAVHVNMGARKLT